MQKSLKKKKTEYSYDLYRDGITQSALSNFLTCPEKFNLSMNQGWASERTGFAIDFGNIVHEALDRVYSGFFNLGNSADAMHRSSQQLELMLNRELSRTAKFRILNNDIEQEICDNYRLAEIVLRHYFQRWFREDKKRDWVFLEKEFSNEYHLGIQNFGTGDNLFVIPMKGKIDGVFRSGKKFRQLETKTKGQINEKEIQDKLTFDLQNFFYLLNSAILLGEKPSGVLYNVIRRPQLKQGAKETHVQFCERVNEDIENRRDFYFMRWDISILPSEYKRWEGEFEIMIERLVQTYEEERYFRNPTGCNAFHRTCQFLPVCSRRDFSGLRIRDEIFPELKVGD